MVNQQVNICDSCHVRTSSNKCIVCGNDLCNYCKRSSFDIIFRSVDMQENIGTVVFCKNCKHKQSKSWDGKKGLFDDKFKEELSHMIGSYLLKRMIVDKL